MPSTAAQIWRNYNTDGVPDSGDRKPPKQEIREWGTDIEDRVEGIEAINSVAVPLQKFGGGSGQLAATNEAAMTAALASGEPQIILPHLNDDLYDFGDAEFVLATGVSVRGDNLTPVKSAAADGLFKVQGYDRRTTVADMLIDMVDASVPDSCAIRMDNYDPLFPFGGDLGAGRTLWGPRIERMRFVNCYHAIADSNHGAVRENNFVATAAQTVFNINYTPSSNSRISVVINGVVKTVVTDYTYSGTIVTLTAPLAGGEAVTITDPYDYAGLITDFMMRDVQTRRARGSQIISRRTQGSILLEDVFIDPQQAEGYVSSIPDIQWPGIDVRNVVGIRMNRVDVVGDGFGVGAGYNANAIGCRIVGQTKTTPFSGISGKYALYIANSTFEANKGTGLLLDNLDSVSLMEVSGRGNRGYGIYAEDMSLLQMTSVRMLGAIGVSGAQAVPVIAIVRGDDVRMENCKASQGAASGLGVIDTIGNIIVDGLIANDNATYPITETGTSASNVYDGIMASGNTTSNIPQIAASSVIGDNSIIGGVPMVLRGSAVFNPPSLADGAGATASVTVTGAAFGDIAIPSFSQDLQGITVSAYVSAANTVQVRFQNETGGVIDLASGTLRVVVKRIIN